MHFVMLVREKVKNCPLFATEAKNILWSTSGYGSDFFTKMFKSFLSISNSLHMISSGVFHLFIICTELTKLVYVLRNML